MTNTETSSSQNGLTGDKNSQESTLESTEPVGQNTDLPTGAKNVQHAIQLAREREAAAKAEAERLANENAELKRQKKAKDLAEMSETERYKSMAEESEARAARAELGMFVRDSIGGKQLPKPIQDLLVKTPWAIPAVVDEIGDSPQSWDEIISSVKKHLPVYVESLVVKTEQPLEEEPSSKRVDSERTNDTVVVRNHIYTKEEVAQIAKDPKEWAKHDAAITKQIADNGGRL